MAHACVIGRGHRMCIATASVRRAPADLRRLGPVEGTGALAFHRGVAGAGYAQENVPEWLALRRTLLAGIDAAAPTGVLVASSTSSLRPCEIQSECARPWRVLVAHPFNPPHLVPPVEIVRAPADDPDAQDAASRPIERPGKAPIRLAKEAAGHVARPARLRPPPGRCRGATLRSCSKLLILSHNCAREKSTMQVTPRLSMATTP